MDEPSYRVFSWPGSLGILITLVLLGVSELGYRLGRRIAAAADEARRSEVGAVQDAVLAMLGLLLGFMFAMALERFDNRRALVVREANAIQTTWLRAGLLPEAHRQPVRALLPEYVQLRLRAPAALKDAGLWSELLRRNAALQSELWEHAQASAIDAPNDITATFISSLNDLFDVGAERLQASRVRLPGTVWLILLLVSGVGCLVSGYGAGVKRVRSALVSVLLPVLVSAVILLIFDLANERRGFIGVSQQPFIDLRDSLQSGVPPGVPR
jgi:hypothetical protein